MKYLAHGVIIFLLFTIFLGVFGGLGVLYYGVWTLILALQFYLLVTGTDITEMAKKDTEYLKSLQDEKGEVADKYINEEVASNLMGKLAKYLSIMVVAFGVDIWQFLGLLSTNWFIFLSLTILGFFVHLPISKVFKESKRFMKVFNWLWGLGRSGVIIFAIINAFHLHIDTYQWFLSLFS